MSMSKNILGDIKDDVVHGAKAPIRAARELVDTVRALRDGRASYREVGLTAGATLGAVLLLVVLLFPLYYMINVALAAGTGAASLYQEGFFASPSEWNLGAFEWLVQESGFFFDPYPGSAPTVGWWEGFMSSYLANSIQLVVPTVVFSMLLIIPAAYAFSRREFMGRKPLLYGYVLLTQVGGGISIAALIAIYVVFNQLGLLNSYLAVAALYAAGAIPFNTWLLKTFMDNIPESYEEAAIMDGASRWRVVWEIILPLAKPGLAVVFIFVFLAGWNEFILAQILLSADKHPLSVGLYSLVDEFSTPWGQFSAFALIYALPVATIYFFSQRYVESGLSFGGMEG
ncbi:sugar ABC transporter permease [Natronoarchaeum sp. GCM10025703]|uniref:sugar ABC transporter permease n=1 Tax=unclassified Natronoarchaeum TaxID=2620183 RepID=UPI00360B4A2E